MEHHVTWIQIGVVSSFLTVKCPVLFTVCINQKQLYIFDYFLYNICTYNLTFGGFFFHKMAVYIVYKCSCMVSSYLKLDVCTILQALHYFIIYFLTNFPPNKFYILVITPFQKPVSETFPHIILSQIYYTGCKQEVNDGLINNTAFPINVSLCSEYIFFVFYLLTPICLYVNTAHILFYTLNESNLLYFSLMWHIALVFLYFHICNKGLCPLCMYMCKV